MENNLEQEKFKIVVPYNNEIMVKGRKKAKIGGGLSCLLITALFVAITIYMGMRSGFTSAAALIFIGIDVLLLGACIFMFCTLKPSSKNNDVVVVYSFYQEGLQIRKCQSEIDEKPRILAYCLYNKYRNKQYVSKLIEDETKLQIRIFTGTYNGVPQYSNHVIPKSVINNEELTALKAFLQQTLGDKYVIKQ